MVKYNSDKINFENNMLIYYTYFSDLTKKNQSANER